MILLVPGERSFFRKINKNLPSVCRAFCKGIILINNTKDEHFCLSIIIPWFSHAEMTPVETK